MGEKRVHANAYTMETELHSSIPIAMSYVTHRPESLVLTYSLMSRRKGWTEMEGLRQEEMDSAVERAEYLQDVHSVLDFWLLLVILAISKHDKDGNLYYVERLCKDDEARFLYMAVTYPGTPRPRLGDPRKWERSASFYRQ